MASISLCCIVKNEEKNLEKFLKHHKELVDEIIIVDTGSTDKTKEIAKEFTDKICSFVWQDDFSLARNFSISKATKEWILWLDPDEYIEEEYFKKIKSLTKNKEIFGYKFLQKTYTYKKYNIKWKASKKFGVGFFYKGIIKLFQNKREIKFYYPVHESVLPSLKAKKLRISSAKIPINHFGRLKSDDELRNKDKYYLSLLKKKYKEFPSSHTSVEIGIQYYLLEDYKNAIFYFEKARLENPQYKDLDCYIKICS